MITRSAVSRPSSWLADCSVVALLAALLYGVVQVGRHWQAPLQLRVDIDLSLWALPGYTLLSLLRGSAAYGVSLGFALSSPFAPPPRPTPGLHPASTLMIFTSQVWTLAFSFSQSLRGIPLELREASRVYQFNWWQCFRRVELPAAAVGLAWNSMMAMAGGWFFLMVCESFTLGSHDFRLPGLGAYMSAAISQRSTRAIVAGLAAMVVMITLVDLCVWRPVLVWVQKFRMEETAAGSRRETLLLTWLRH